MKDDNAMNLDGLVQGADSDRTNLVRPASREHGRGAATASPRAKNRSEGLQSAPPDLLAFLTDNTLSDAVEALRLSRPQIVRLRGGYWPTDARKITQAWDAFKGRHFVRSTSWFLRRVGADGLLRHGRHAYSAAKLASRAGELLAVARSADGALVAVALELPAERITLQRLEG